MATKLRRWLLLSGKRSCLLWRRRSLLQQQERPLLSVSLVLQALGTHQCCLQCAF